MKHKRKVAVLTVLLSLVCTGTYVRGADALLDNLPADCVGVVRVNNLNDALTKLDTYLAGASPVPVSLAMLVNMQLTQITGDAMLNGIDKSGSFILLALPAGEEEVIAGLLMPVTSFDEFTKNNQNITKLDEKTSLLSAPNSTIGAVVLASVMGGKYALTMPESEKDSMALLQKAIEDKSAKRLSARLSEAQAKEATSAPAWCFVNVSMLYDKHGQELIESIEEGMQAVSQEQTAGMMEMAGKMYSEMFKTFAQDMDSVTLAVKPEAALLTIDTTLRAKDGSEMAKMLVADPAAAKDYKLAGFTDNSYAVNGLMRMNRPFFEKMNAMMIKIIDAAAKEGTAQNDSAKMKALMEKWMTMMGKEFAFSFSYAAGMPPVRFREVIDMKEGASAKTLMKDGIDMANEMYKSMGMPVALSYQPATETYKQTAIDTLKITFTEAGQQDEEFAQIMKMMDPNGMQYYMAQKGNLLFMTMGPKGVEEIKTLIDQPTTSTVSGDMKTALDMLSSTGYTDYAASVNIINLMKGMGEMMQSMGGQQGMNPFANIFSGINMQSQSCLVMGGKIADGQLGMRVALPKQHLIEVVTAAMQIQQKVMQQQMQPPMGQEPNQGDQSQSSGSPLMPQTTTKTETAEASALKTWIGKKAPELKMVDLSGQTHRISRLKGKKVVLDFWATWCPPCKESIPHLIALQGKISPEKAAIIGLSNEAQDKVTEYTKNIKINYPIAVYKNEEVPAPYGQVTNLPTMFLIDAEGTIVDVIEGYDPDTTPQKIETFLK